MERAFGTRVLGGKGEKQRSEVVRLNGKKHANPLVPTAFPLCSAVCFLVVLDVKIDFRRNGVMARQTCAAVCAMYA